MSFSLLIFPPSPDAKCTLTRMDDGLVVDGTPATHPSGRVGQAFEIPADTLNGHGAVVKITTKKTFQEQRGILYLRVPGFDYPWSYPEKTAALETDDFREPTIVHSGRTGVVRLV